MVSLRKNVALAETDSGAVLLDETTGRYFQLNTSGLFSLNQLLRGDSVQVSAEALSSRYPVNTQQAKHDIETLLRRLAELNLVTG